MAKQINIINSIPTTTRAYCACKLVQICDLYNECDGLALESEVFLRRKREYEQKIQEVDIDTIEMLNQCGILDGDYQIKSDELLLNKIKEEEIKKCNEQYEAIINELQQNGLIKCAQAILLHSEKKSLHDLSLPNRGKAKNLKEMLAQDFAFAKLEDPNNELLQAIVHIVEKQTNDLPYVVYFVEADKETNSELRKQFNNEERSKFYTFMGTILELGSNITNQMTTIPQDIKLSETNRQNIDEIRRLSESDCSNEEIASMAIQAYVKAANGCWYYKNEQSGNPGGKKNDYIKKNVGMWISALKQGKSGIAHLCFIDPIKGGTYKSDADMWDDEKTNMPITIHHKIDEKYHNLLPEDSKYLLHGIWNLEMIIGGELHTEEHPALEKTLVSINGKNYFMLKLDKRPDNSILKTYSSAECNKSTKVIFACKQPEIINKFRKIKTQINEIKMKIMAKLPKAVS